MDANLAPTFSFPSWMSVMGGNARSLGLVRVICFVASRAQRKGRFPAPSALVWNGLDRRGPFTCSKERNGWEGMDTAIVPCVAPRDLFAVLCRRHGVLPGTLVLETATDC